VTALVNAERHDQALRAVGAFLAKHDETTSATISAFVEQGYIDYKMKRFRVSLRAFDRALELDSGSGPALVGRAVGLYTLVRDRESTVAYRRARDLAPQDARSLDSLGMILIASRQFDSALMALDRAQELDPFDFDFAQNRLFALRKPHRYRQYVRDLLASTLRIWRNQREQEDSRKELS
jgi:Flp pilus assembly protein TadD